MTIESLNQANIALQMERDAMAQEVTQVKERNQDLQRRQENMEGIIEAGRVLQAMDLTPMAIRVTSTGSQRETGRAKRAEMIKTCFTLMENRIADKGARTLFLEVVSPGSRGHERRSTGIGRPVAGLQRRAHGGLHLLHGGRALRIWGVHGAPCRCWRAHRHHRPHPPLRNCCCGHGAVVTGRG